MVESTADAMQAYYARGEERDRLAAGVGRIEFMRTAEVIGRTLPAAPAVIADIGGGPGRYTDWLADQGYAVIHRDVVVDHVEQVRSRHPDVDTKVGDACALDLPDGCVDVVLLLGPLYHLRERGDRVQALREAHRIARAGGVVHAAAISRWAARLDGILVQRLHEIHPGLVELVGEAERTGWMRPAHDSAFTCATHTPASLTSEVEDAGLTLDSLVSVEGIAFALADIDERSSDPAQLTLVMDTLRVLESVPDLLGVGPHMLVTARRGV
jgi:SAM-dependent methyltransferase